MKDQIDRMNTAVERIQRLARLVAPILPQLSENCSFCPSVDGFTVYHATREDLKLVLSLTPGRAWEKADPGDGDVRYSCWGLEFEGSSFYASIDVSELAPSCRLETYEEHVPAHTRKRTRVVCGPQAEAQPA